MRHANRAASFVGLLLSLSACGEPAQGPSTDAGPAGDAEVDGVDADREVDAAAPRPLTCEVVPGGCDEVLTDAGGTWLSIVDRHAPGRTICIAAGEYSQLYLRNVSGEEGAPVTIINCGGRVVFDSDGQQIGIEGVYVEHLHLTGAGDPSIEHGIEEHGADLHGISFDQGITDVEIDHVEVHDVEWVGIGVRSYPRCDGLHNRSNWTQLDTNVHHNFVHDVSRGEGMYIGTSHYHLAAQAYLADCPELGLMEPPLRRVHVYDNVLEDIGADGIQVGAAIEGMEITRNVVRRYALRRDPGDIGGIQINPGSVGLVHDNWIEAVDGDPVSTAIQYAGGSDGDIDIYDNVIVVAAVALMTLGRMPAPEHRTIFRDNTVVSRGGILMELFCNPELREDRPHETTMTGNVFVGYASIGPLVFEDATGPWYRIFGNAASGCTIDGEHFANSREPDLEVPGNFYSHDVGDAQFVDAAAADYRLMPGSPAEGMGATID